MEDAKLTQGLRSQLKSPAQAISSAAVQKAAAELPAKPKVAVTPTLPTPAVAPASPEGSDKIELKDLMDKGLIIGVNKEGKPFMLTVGQVSELERYGLMHYVQSESASISTARGLQSLSKLAQQTQQAQAAAPGQPAV